MNKSNIFVYVELSKLINNLSTDPELCKNALQSQAGYFNIIETKYFSKQLASEWEQITAHLKEKGPKLSSEGIVEKNAFRNTLYQMSTQECLDVTGRLILLLEKIKKELDINP